MTREEFARRIRWAWIAWLIGVINPTFMMPQLIQIWLTREVAALSLTTLAILIFIQGGFALHGYLTRDSLIFVSNILAITVTILTVLSTMYFRFVVG